MPTEPGPRTGVISTTGNILELAPFGPWRGITPVYDPSIGHFGGYIGHGKNHALSHKTNATSQEPRRFVPKPPTPQAMANEGSWRIVSSFHNTLSLGHGEGSDPSTTGPGVTQDIPRHITP